VTARGVGQRRKKTAVADALFLVALCARSALSLHGSSRERERVPRGRNKREERKNGKEERERDRTEKDKRNEREGERRESHDFLLLQV